MARKKKQTTTAPEYMKLDVDTLEYDQHNPRARTDRNLDAIRRSVAEHGQVEPVLVQASTLRVIHGNGRLQALAEAGYKEVDCAVIDVNDQQARKLSIVLNRTGELATWDASILGGHLDALLSVDKDFDVTTLGFTGTELEDLLADANAVVEELSMPDAPEPYEERVAQRMKDGEYEEISGMKAEDAERTKIRVAQLFLNDGNIDQFNAACRDIGSAAQLSNLTDVVWMCVMNEHQRIVGLV